MPQKPVVAREGEEVWETTTDGVLYYTTTDSRGRDKINHVGGKSGTRFRIPSTDREINQDRVREHNDDPWVNGYLKRVDADQNDVERTASDQALSTEELVAYFAKTGNAFQSQVRKLNERNVRRMLMIAEDMDVSTSQIEFLRRHIEENYKIQGSMPSYDEMVADGFIRESG